MKSRTPARAPYMFGMGIRFAHFRSGRLEKHSQSGGYTFLEVMIVMAVTGALFASVVVMFSGKQSATQFNQGMRDYEAKIQSVASDVATGYYDTGNFNCNGTTPGLVTFDQIAPINKGGSNKSCLFLGKILTTSLNYTDIFTLAGHQYKAGTLVDVETLAEAGPTPVLNGTIDITENYVPKFGLMIKNVYTINGDISVGGFGFMSELTGGIGGGNPDTGSRGVQLYRFAATNSPNGNNRAANASAMNASTLKLTPDGIRVCLWDGGQHRGEITVGENGSQTSTELTIDNGISTVCKNA